MLYDLSPTRRPDLVVVLDAGYAEAMVSAAHIAQRMMEIMGAPAARLGIISMGDMQRVGRMDVLNVHLDSPVPVEEYGSRLKLNEQRAIVSEFRRLFSGPLRGAVNMASRAFDGRTIYFVFYEQGAVIVVPSVHVKDRWRLAALRLEGASTMAEERSCVVVNQASKETYELLWEGLTEHARKEAEADPSLREDVMDAAEERAEHASPPAGPATLADEEDEIEDAATDYGDPTDPSASAPSADGEDYEYDPDTAPF